MSKPHNIFISWSGDRSKWIAEALHNWLPKVLQSARPWVSTQDIEKGTRGLSEMSNALNGMGFGITCLTPENLQAEWILYEAGALSKTFQDDKTRLWTYLLAGLENKDVKPPLGQFQHTKTDKEDTRKLIHSINAAINSLDDRLSENMVNEAFDRWWPDLETKIKTMPSAKGAVVKERSSDEILAEILQLCRQYLPQIDEISGPTLAVPWSASGFGGDPVANSLGSLGRLGTFRSGSVPLSSLIGTKTYCIKLKNDDKVKRVEGTKLEEVRPGTVLVIKGNEVMARFEDSVENWWEEPDDA